MKLGARPTMAQPSALRDVRAIRSRPIGALSCREAGSFVRSG